MHLAALMMTSWVWIRRGLCVCICIAEYRTSSFFFVVTPAFSPLVCLPFISCQRNIFSWDLGRGDHGAPSHPIAPIFFCCLSSLCLLSLSVFPFSFFLLLYLLFFTPKSIVYPAFCVPGLEKGYHFCFLCACLEKREAEK